MRLAIVSDIHGNLPALQAVQADIARRGVDAVVNLGDSLSGPLLPLPTAQMLMYSAWPTLAGNHERNLLALAHAPDAEARAACAATLGPSDRFAYQQLGATELAWLATLPATLRLDHEVFLCHGTPGDDLSYLLETVPQHNVVRLASADEIAARLAGSADAAQATLIACGHSHTPRAVRLADGRLLVNPGSVGLPAYDHDRPFVHVIENGAPDARYALVERVAAGWQCALLAVSYDALTMARLAAERGFDDWARALRSGWAR